MNKVSQTGIQTDKILKTLEKENLILQKDIKLSDLLIPGRLSRFLLIPGRLSRFLIKSDFDYSKE